MRPRLREDCYYAPVDDGVFLETASGSTRLEGRGIHQLFERLVPHLDGGQTLDAIVAHLPEDQRELVTRLVRVLEQHGLVWDRAKELPHRLSTQEVNTYAQEIGFLDLLGGSGAHYFERFRNKRVLVVGAGLVLAELINILLRLGLRRPALLQTPEVGTDRSRIMADLRAARDRDPALDLVETPGPADWSSVGALRAVLSGVDMVLHCTDRPMLGRATLVNRAARAAGVPALQAQVVAGVAWIGAIGAGGHNGCWECGWLRLLGGLSAGDPGFDAHLPEDRPGAEPERYLSEPMSALVAGNLAFAAFTLVAHRDSGGVSRFSRVELATGLTSTHEFHSHPLCQACATPAPPAEADFRAALSALQVRPATTPEAFTRAAVRLIEPRLGLVRSLDDAGYRQFPVNLAEATLADPTARGGGAAAVARAGADLSAARRHAATAAIEKLAGELVDQRRLIPGPAGPRAWAWDPETEAIELAPADLLFPLSSCGACRAVAGGGTWPEAIGRALLWHCHRLTALEPPSDDGADQWLSAAALLGTRGSDLTVLGDRTGPAPALYDHTGPLGVPTVAVRIADGTLASASALDLASAARTAVDSALLRQQGVEAVPVIPAAMAGTDWSAELPQLVKRLSEAGWRVLATPLDHDPAVTAVLPCIAAVALVDRHGERTPS